VILDLFAGPGGWSEGLRSLGSSDVGIEHDLSACQTRVAAGHQTVRADVAAYPTGPFVGKVDGLIASPPCQAYSTAGKGLGLIDVPRITAHAYRCENGWHDYDRDGWNDPRSPLVLEPLRWALGLVPRWVACEQVPAVLPLWETFSHVLRAHGWLTWCGILNAADYGVPQTRQRAILVARRDCQPVPPVPTHTRYPAPSLFGPELVGWVSMADALGWGFPEPACTVSSGGTRTGGAEPFANAGYRERLGAFVKRERSGDRSEEGFTPDQPSQTLTSKARSWSVTRSVNGFDERDPVAQFDGQIIDSDAFGVFDAVGVDVEVQVDEHGVSHGGEHDRRPADVKSEWIVQTGNNSHVTSREGSKAGEGGVELYERSVDEPAPTLDAKAGRAWQKGGTRADAQTVPADQSAPTIDGKGRWHVLVEQGVWSADRPATTIAGDPRVFQPGGHHTPGAQSQNSIKLTLADALTLQSFRPDYPVRGSRTKQFEQVGNAIPPVLAAAILASLGEAV
jgi:DNA (cytosine-5)-methyltransferase 1